MRQAIIQEVLTNFHDVYMCCHEVDVHTDTRTITMYETVAVRFLSLFLFKIGRPPESASTTRNHPELQKPPDFANNQVLSCLAARELKRPHGAARPALQATKSAY